MNPVIAEKTRYAPKHAEWFNGTGRLGLAHVRRFPAELIEDCTYDRLRCLVVPANEDSWLAALELRVHHARAAD